MTTDQKVDTLATAIQELVEAIQYFIKCFQEKQEIQPGENPFYGTGDKQQQQFNVPERIYFGKEGFARFKTAQNSIPGEKMKSNMPSKTIPDQSMSVPELMSRYVRGLPLGGQRVPVYDEDPENPMPDLSKMDIIDKHEAIQDAKDELRDISLKYQKEKDDKKQAAYEEYKRKFEELDKKYKTDIGDKVHLTPIKKEQ